MMDAFLEDLSIAIEVLRDWRALAALAAFVFTWTLTRHVASVWRRPGGARRRISRPKSAAKPVAAPVTEPDEDDFPED
jgi:hypothetical protein